MTSEQAQVLTDAINALNVTAMSFFSPEALAFYMGIFGVLLAFAFLAGAKKL